MKNGRFVRFAKVGAVGFVVDIVVFSILVYLIGIPLMLSRVLAFIVAATTTWLGNRIYTFNSTDARFTQWKRFFVSACISMIPNLIVFKGLVLYLGEGSFAHYIAFVLGVGAGLMGNYLLSSRWVFR
ncbi:polysaccharide biosynthesis protein GtrA [Vibrio sp. UCD-FRSSP16_10]|uniref:GtrA family protein n=1 Tax=unclassified Vibrio TaxID=2614977 RepID=UPI0007FC0643|nr:MULTISPECIES: GtrA family protein [unclassified Vibrio]OBT13435.1 polysaccharide biosynthesis protein GtrA [Vibrio sp. UCD-FRSSP16_10]OBT17945.1 polysaccharide biosynthesis protein GtrA [Vibrio sp. UCD-FRSSP16_30]